MASRTQEKLAIGTTKGSLTSLTDKNFFMTDPIFRKLFLFCKGLENVFQKREQKKNENKIGKEGHLGKDIRYHLLRFLEIFIFRSQFSVQVQSEFGAFFSCDT